MVGLFAVLFVDCVDIGLVVYELSCCSLLCIYVSLYCFVLDGMLQVVGDCGGFVNSVAMIIILFIW